MVDEMLMFKFQIPSFSESFYWNLGFRNLEFLRNFTSSESISLPPLLSQTTTSVPRQKGSQKVGLDT